MEKLIKKAHDKITRIKGKDYAPNAREIEIEILKECKCIRFIGGTKWYSNGCKIHPNK